MQIKKVQRIEFERELLRKKKIIFYDSRKSISMKNIVGLYVSISSFIFFREALKDLFLTEKIHSKCKMAEILIFRSLSREHLL